MPATVERYHTTHQGPVFVLYRTAAGVARERFTYRNLGAALQRAEFIERVEGCPVYFQHGRQGRLVRAVI
jgi:hypothetical protein